MHEHPRSEPRGRVRRAVAHGLRTRRQHREVGRVSRQVVLAQRLDDLALLIGDSRWYWRAAERWNDLGRYGRRKIDVDAEQSRGRLSRHGARDRRAPVAALRHIVRVSKALHQLRPGLRDAVGVPAGALRLAGEAVPRHRGDDDVEGVAGAAAVRGWIRERTDDLELLDDRSWPAVRDDDRKRILMKGPDVDEVDLHPVDGGLELRQRIE